MSRRLLFHLTPAVVISVLGLAPLAAQTSSPAPDRWQLTLKDRSYPWNVRLVRLSQDTTADSGAAGLRSGSPVTRLAI